jgi:hypothetical protein
MEARKYYMHKAAKDVFIEVLRVMGPSDDSLSVLVQWWNLGFTGNPWMLPNRTGGPLQQVIKNDHIKNWVEFEPTEDWKDIRDRQRTAV